MKISVTIYIATKLSCGRITVAPKSFPRYPTLMNIWRAGPDMSSIYPAKTKQEAEDAARVVYLRRIQNVKDHAANCGISLPEEKTRRAFQYSLDKKRELKRQQLKREKERLSWNVLYSNDDELYEHRGKEMVALCHSVGLTTPVTDI